MSLLNSDDPFNPTQYAGSTGEVQRVILTDVDMSIGAMIRFMLKWAIAAIPASLIIGFFWLIVIMVIRAAFR